MRKRKSRVPKYRVTKIGDPPSETIYAAGPGQEGGGYLVFHETWVEAIPKPESAWRKAMRAKRKTENQLRLADGSWHPWFLLTRAMVLSKESMEESGREEEGAKTIREAKNYLTSAAKAQAMASDARRHAILESFLYGIDIPPEVAASDRAFTSWYDEQVIAHAEANDHGFIETLNGFARAANSLQKGYPNDVLQFIRALEKEASSCRKPPEKEKVRIALGRILKAVELTTHNLRAISGEAIDLESLSDSTCDIVDPNTLTRLLERTGFRWLPDGKPGPKQRSKSGKGKAPEVVDVCLPKRKRQ